MQLWFTSGERINLPDPFSEKCGGQQLRKWCVDRTTDIHALEQTLSTCKNIRDSQRIIAMLKGGFLNEHGHKAFMGR